MSSKTFKKATIRAAVYEDAVGGDILVLEEAGEWVDKGKYQHQGNSMKLTETQ